MYKIKKEIAEKIENKYLVRDLEFSECYVSQLLNQKRVVPKHTAYAITKWIGLDKEIEDIFEKVGK